MGSGCSGDFAELEALARHLTVMSELGIRSIAQDASIGLTGLLEDEFSSSHDPYGMAWVGLAPSTVRRKGHATILVDTHAMASGVTCTPGEDSITVTVPTPAEYHQEAFKAGRVARPILPQPTGALPDRWSETIAASAEKMLAQLARGEG